MKKSDIDEKTGKKKVLKGSFKINKEAEPKANDGTSEGAVKGWETRKGGKADGIDHAKLDTIIKEQSGFMDIGRVHIVRAGGKFEISGFDPKKKNYYGEIQHVEERLPLTSTKKEILAAVDRIKAQIPGENDPSVKAFKEEARKQAEFYSRPEQQARQRAEASFPSHVFKKKDGTSEGAIKGWETRRGGVGPADPSKATAPIPPKLDLRSGKGPKWDPTAPDKWDPSSKKPWKANEQQKVRGLRHLMSNLIREETLDGKKFLAVPTILICEGVHNDGFYPADEIAKYPEAWNGRPVVVKHPKIEGIPVAASQPEILEKQAIGTLFNSSYDGSLKKLRSEAWIDVEKCKKNFPEVLKKLEDNEKIEVSTGLFTDDELNTLEEKWNEEEYAITCRNFRPDHLAIIPNGKGACSWEDGAGMPRVNEEENMKLNELSFDEIRIELSDALRDATPKKLNNGMLYDGPWISTVYKDYFIFQKDGAKFKQAYTVDASDEVQIVGKPVEVEQRTSYEPVKANSDCSDMSKSEMEQMVEDGDMSQEDMDAEMKKRMKANTTSSEVQTTPNRKGQNMDRDKKILQLIAGGKWNEADTEFLKALEDDQFAKIEALSAPVEQPKVNEEVEEAEESEEAEEVPEVPKVLSAEDYVAAAPAEVGSVLKRALARDRQIKAELIKGLKANSRCSFTDEQLQAKDLEELQAIAQLAQVEVDYGPSAGSAPKVNEEAEEAAPEMPSLFAK